MVNRNGDMVNKLSSNPTLPVPRHDHHQEVPLNRVPYLQNMNVAVTTTDLFKLQEGLNNETEKASETLAYYVNKKNDSDKK